MYACALFDGYQPLFDFDFQRVAAERLRDAAWFGVGFDLHVFGYPDPDGGDVRIAHPEVNVVVPLLVAVLRQVRERRLGHEAAVTRDVEIFGRPDRVAYLDRRQRFLAFVAGDPGHLHHRDFQLAEQVIGAFPLIHFREFHQLFILSRLVPFGDVSLGRPILRDRDFDLLYHPVQRVGILRQRDQFARAVAEDDCVVPGDFPVYVAERHLGVRTFEP